MIGERAMIFLHLRLLETRRRAWVVSFLYVLFLLGTAPFILRFSAWLRGHHLLRVFLISLAAGCLIYILAYFVSRLKIRNLKAYLGIGLLLAAAGLLMLRHQTLEERIHLLEYTALALLFFKAVKFSRRGKILFVLPLLLTIFIGWIDELWQGLLPGRVYDILDVLNNAAGGMIGVSIAWIRQTYGGEAPS